MDQSKIKPLEQRTIQFARDTAQFTQTLPKTTANIEYAKQIIRSSASVGANYLEAGESLSRKDFIHRIRIARKEAKETQYWLQLIIAKSEWQSKQEQLIRESLELMKILSTIATKTSLKESAPSIR